MDKIKLKDLKYEIPGHESDRGAFSILIAFMVMPSCIALICFVVAFGKMIDRDDLGSVVGFFICFFVLVYVLYWGYKTSKK